MHVHRQDSTADLLKLLDFEDVSGKIVGDVSKKIGGAKDVLASKKLEVESDVVSKFEGVKQIIESKEREVERGLGSAAENMFMRFDAFRNKVSEEEDNAKKAFERFDAFLKSSDKPQDK